MTKGSLSTIMNISRYRVAASIIRGYILYKDIVIVLSVIIALFYKDNKTNNDQLKDLLAAPGYDDLYR